MKTFPLLLLFSINLLNNLYGQKAKIIGKVVDEESNEAVNNMLVTLANSPEFTSTNISGFFEVIGDSLNITLSHVSYITTEIYMDSSKPRVLIRIPRHIYELEGLSMIGDIKIDNFFVYNMDIWKTTTQNCLKSSSNSQAEFPDGIPKFHQYIMEKISDTKNSESINFNCVIQFAITKEGIVEDVRNLNPFIGDSLITSIFKNSPRWIPSHQQGSPVVSWFKQPVIFDSSFELYAPVETQPEFKGGLGKFFNIISSNLNYPKEARKNNIEGRVMISFVVNKEGNLEEVLAVNGLGYGCDEEAVRLVKLTSGKWNPGEQRGRPVKVRMIIPISFIK